MIAYTLIFCIFGQLFRWSKRAYHPPPPPPPPPPPEEPPPPEPDEEPGATDAEAMELETAEVTDAIPEPV